MSGVLKVALPILGEVVGGFFGGPAGAVAGGALGGYIGGAQGGGGSKGGLTGALWGGAGGFLAGGGAGELMNSLGGTAGSAAGSAAGAGADALGASAEGGGGAFAGMGGSMGADALGASAEGGGGAFAGMSGMGGDGGFNGGNILGMTGDGGGGALSGMNGAADGGATGGGVGLGTPVAPTTVGGGGNPGESMLDKLRRFQAGKGVARGEINIGTGVMGMLRAEQMRKAADPFAQYRAQYAQQLQQLEANPGSMTTMPGYQAGLQAVQRAGAAQGYTGSGNMAAGLAGYGQNFFQQQQQMLAQLGGAGAPVGQGAAASYVAENNAWQGIGNGLGSMVGP